MYVYPGDRLCSLEEFLPGDGVYVDRDGVVRAARLGVVDVDVKSRRIMVRALSGRPRMPRRGSTLYALLYAIPREDLGLVKIMADERMIPYSGGFTGVLHVSQASDTFTKSLYDVARPGDIIRAQSLSNTSPYMLSTRRPQDGVVLAFCSLCGAPLYRVPGRSSLVCLRCGNEERRKIAGNYLLVSRERL